jgi:NAD(P)-dependent dehydrogenase (short-subunit alcohol dehydrogenase family)
MSIAVITGAGAGVGRATARAFARAGYDVALIARDADRLEAAADEVRSLGRRALVLPLDVADPDAVEAAAERTEDELGPIDVWVNGAMTSVVAPVDQLTSEEIRRVSDVTYLGTAYGTQAALRRMRLRDKGVIVQIGSGLAYRSVPLQAAYCAAKSAARGFTDSVPPARGEHPAVQLGPQPPAPRDAATPAGVSARARRPGDRLGRRTSASRDARRVADCARGPRPAARAGSHGPLSRESRVGGPDVGRSGTPRQS